MDISGSEAMTQLMGFFAFLLVNFFFIVVGLSQAQAQAQPAPRVHKDVYLLRHHPEIGGFETLEVSYEESEALGVTTRVVRREFHRGSPPGGLLAVPGDSPGDGDPDDFHFSLIEPDLNFVIPRYDRRKWGEGFSAKLRALARDFLHDSIYVTVFDQDGKRTGAIRFIHRPYLQRRTPEGVEILDSNHDFYGPAKGVRPAEERPNSRDLPKPPSALPEASYLGLELPMRFAHQLVLDDKQKIAAFLDEAIEWEVGNLGVDETRPVAIRTATMSEIWIQIMRFAFSQPWSKALLGTTLHAYADEKSLHLYLPWGFEYLREYVLDGGRVRYAPDQTPPPIRKDGINWWPIVWYPENILKFNDKVSEHGFRSFSAARLRARREETAPGGGADQFSGFSVMMQNIEFGGERIAQASIRAMIQLFESLQIYHENQAASCPRMDYGSDFANDPMMFGYKTYCEMVTLECRIWDRWIGTVLPYLWSLASHPAGGVAQQRVQQILSALAQIPALERYVRQVQVPRLDSELVENPLSDRWRAIESESQTIAAVDSRASSSELSSLEVVAATLNMVKAIKEKRYTALVLSGESAILSYSLLKAGWGKVEGRGMAMPPVFVIHSDLNDHLKNMDKLPTESVARAIVDSDLPSLRRHGGKVLVLDDHTHTGIKYVRQKDFFLKAGLLSVTYGFLAIHPDSLAIPDSLALGSPTLGLFSVELVKQFRQLGELLHSNPKEADRQIAVWVKVVQDAVRCEARLFRGAVQL